MPSRRRAHLSPSAASASTATPAPSSPARASRRNKQLQSVVPATSSAASSPVLSASDSVAQSTSPEPWVPDQWTPAQETALFKAIVRHKPTGMNKHFHMMSIFSYLEAHGLTYPVPSTPLTSVSKPAATASKSRMKTGPTTGQSADTTAEPEPPLRHTSIPGIWEKLNELYDLEALDEKEFSYAALLDSDVPSKEFRLPGDVATGDKTAKDEDNDGAGLEDEDLNFLKTEIWARRFPKTDHENDDTEKSKVDAGSAPGSPYILSFRRGPDGTVEDVSQITTRSSKATAASKKGVASTGGTRASARKSAVSTPLAETKPPAAPRRSGRRDTSARATPTTEATPDAEAMAIDKEEDEQEGDEVDGSENSEQEDGEDGEEEGEDEEGDTAQTSERDVENEDEDEKMVDAEPEAEDDNAGEEEAGDDTARATRSTRSSARTRRR